MPTAIVIHSEDLFEARRRAARAARLWDLAAEFAASLDHLGPPLNVFEKRHAAVEAGRGWADPARQAHRERLRRLAGQFGQALDNLSAPCAAGGVA